MVERERAWSIFSGEEGGGHQYHRKHNVLIYHAESSLVGGGRFWGAPKSLHPYVFIYTAESSLVGGGVYFCRGAALTLLNTFLNSSRIGRVGLSGEDKNFDCRKSSFFDHQVPYSHWLCVRAMAQFRFARKCFPSMTILLGLSVRFRFSPKLFSIAFRKGHRTPGDFFLRYLFPRFFALNCANSPPK